MKKFLICFFIFVITGIGSAFLGVPGDATFVVGGVCAVLYLIFARKKVKSTDKRTTYSSNSTSSNYRSSKAIDYFDERNIPRHWAKARVCDNGNHDNITVSQGNATRCYKCGRPFDGEWG